MYISCIYIKTLHGIRRVVAIAQVCVSCLLSDFLIIHISFYLYVARCYDDCIIAYFFFVHCSSFPSIALDECELCSTSSSVPFCHFRRVKSDVKKHYSVPISACLNLLFSVYLLSFV